MILFCKEGDSRKRMMFLFLMAALIMEFLFITLESQVSYLGYYLTEEYLLVPTLLFLGCALGGQLSKFAKQRIFLAGAAIFWFVLVQIIHKLSGMDTHPVSTVFFVYLMAFPFASAAEDRESFGLNWIGGMFLTASLVQVAYAGLLMLELVPEALEEYIYWDGGRLHVFWHSNISACFLMLGVGFSAVFLVRTKHVLLKLLLLTAIVLQMVVMAMTNCRTTLLLTGAMLGGTLFLPISRKIHRKSVRLFGRIGKIVIVCIVLVPAVLFACFKVSGEIFQWNNERLIREEVSNIRLTDVNGENVESIDDALQEDTGIIQGDNQQGSLSQDMGTLNGRDEIWTSALTAVRNDKSLLLWGTEYSGQVISMYNRFPVVHGHNAWVESLLRQGLPGLLISMVFTVLSVWSAAKVFFHQTIDIWKKVIAMLTMCVMLAGFLEPYLFITNVYYHVPDFAFFVLTGYLDYWCSSGIKQSI